WTPHHSWPLPRKGFGEGTVYLTVATAYQERALEQTVLGIPVHHLKVLDRTETDPDVTRPSLHLAQQEPLHLEPGHPRRGRRCIDDDISPSWARRIGFLDLLVRIADLSLETVVG